MKKLFYIAALTDLIATYFFMQLCVMEANPVAYFFYKKFGFAGLVVIKALSVFVFIVIHNYVIKHREALAKFLMGFAVCATCFAAGSGLYTIKLASTCVPVDILPDDSFAIQLNQLALQSR